MVEPLTASLIIGGVIIIMNFIAYITFRFFLDKKFPVKEGIGFTFWDTFLELIIVMPLTFALTGGFSFI